MSICLLAWSCVIKHLAGSLQKIKDNPLSLGMGYTNGSCSGPRTNDSYPIPLKTPMAWKVEEQKIVVSAWQQEFDLKLGQGSGLA
ncbi:hypothetical protein PBY51_020819 [Eleginops maclovinus]|uniref:Uncharacterized protein n=1 Tax=Eleginops maclovinus TaxID=56733 RepID=A0AAN7XU53_ELEMC|nr:hypothetical protein PBY51_020819 [Eleginops maclovinus]